MGVPQVNLSQVYAQPEIDLTKLGVQFLDLPPTGEGLNLDWSGSCQAAVNLSQVKEEEIWTELARFG